MASIEIPSERGGKVPFTEKQLMAFVTD